MRHLRKLSVGNNIYNMKFLKTYNESIFDWYEEISDETWREWINNSIYKKDIFTDSEKEMIKSKFDDMNDIRLSPNVIQINYNRDVVTINKFEDEWFTCRSYKFNKNTSTYRCDTLEGLLKLIDDIKK